MGPGSGTAARSHWLSKEARDRALFVSDSSKPSDQPESSAAMDSSTMETCDSSENQSTNNTGHPEAVTKVGISEKEEKLKNTSVRHASEKSKVPRDQRKGGKLKAENQSNAGEMVRKSMKGVGISSSKMGRLAVGVTS